jgi:uncharacterized protein with PIN domain
VDAQRVKAPSDSVCDYADEPDKLMLSYSLPGENGLEDMTAATAEFRFYAELNFFVAPHLRNRAFAYRFPPDATVKHMIEALGAPHTEVELILADGEPVDFSFRMRSGARISIFPHFYTFDIPPDISLQARQTPSDRFIADSHLGLLAKNMRMLGFDVLYHNNYSDAELVRIALHEQRIVLTRDRDLLIRKDVVRGCYLHATLCDEQLCEVFARFNLAPAVRAFSRCLICNGLLVSIDKQTAAGRVPQASGRLYNVFFECRGCGQVYWEGSHVLRMRRRIAQVLRLCSGKSPPAGPPDGKLSGQIISREVLK